MFRTASRSALLLAVTVIFTASAQSKSYFRQNGGVATNDSASLPSEFGERQLVWKRSLDPGVSTPCVLGDQVFVTTYNGDKHELATTALDRATGEIKWRQLAPVRKLEAFHSTGSPACSTPATDGKRLYVMFGSYGMLCYGLDGKLLWKRELGPFQDEFGAASSPVLVDGKVIINQDHDVDCYLMALDAESGKTIWKTPRNGFTRSYSSPIIVEDNGQKQIVVAGSLQLTSYDLESGKRIWWTKGLSRIVDTTPVQVGSHVFVATWTPGGDSTNRISMEAYPEALKIYDKNGDKKIAKEELPKDSPVVPRFFRIDLDLDGKLDQVEWEKHAKVFELAQNAAMAVRLGGTGDVSETHVEWKATRGIPTVPSPLVYRGAVYLVKDGGIITSLNAKTGEIIKQGRAKGRGNYYASPVAGDGKVYIVSERGVLTILKAGTPWEIVGQHDFGERIMATPVVQDGEVFVRTDAGVYCYRAK